MNKELLENLLYQEESETLDFKSQQYKFSKASDELKSEILKDILAFANSWRRTDAYILIGVQEIKGEKSKVVGVDSHLLNRNLQQFVNSKTNRALKFSYQQFKQEKYEIGIIKIPTQERPVFLNNNYGNLHANKVYIRRGDTTAVANPDEIARMGKALDGQSTKQPDIDLQFANLKTREELGTELKIDSEKLFFDEVNSLPTYGNRNGSSYQPAVGPNPDYYRDIAKYLLSTYHLNEIGLVLENKSDVLAENVHIEVIIDDQKVLNIFDEDSYPEEPSTMNVPLNNIRSIFEDTKTRKIHASQYGNKWHLESDFGNLQPKAKIWSSNTFFIGLIESGTVKCEAKIIANNLSKPITYDLGISFQTKLRQLNSDDMENCEKELEG